MIENGFVIICHQFCGQADGCSADSLTSRQLAWHGLPESESGWFMTAEYSPYLFGLS